MEGREMGKFVIGVLVFLLVVSAALLPGAASPRDVGSEVAAKLDVAFMRKVIEDLTAIGSSPMGFRTAGTPEDLKTAMYIVEQMEAMGLDGVGLEPVPIDMWRFKGASLTVTSGGGTWSFQAASQGGVPPTPPGGLTGEIVFVGKGLATDYEALAAQGISVEGKLALADWDFDEVWTNHIAMEAIARGAMGSIITMLPGGDFYQAPDAIGSFDSVCDPVLCGSFITISKEDALAILALLAQGPVTGTMVLDVEIQEDTVGYNTIGYIAGTTRADELILFNSHHDAWFQGAVDDTSGVAVILAIAKAIQESGYRPSRTLVFMTSTGEEWGYMDTYYDWLAGSWYRITQAHPEWQSKAVVLINMEGSGFPGDPLEVNVNHELRSFLARMLGTFRHLTPYGFSVHEVFSWNELWTYAAAGVPGFTFSSSGDIYTNTVYHTNKDTIEVIDFGYLAQTTEFVARVAVALDSSPLQPWDFGRRVKHLEDNVDFGAMGALLGTEDATIPRVQEAVERFKEAVKAYEGARKSLPADKAVAVQMHAREALRLGLTEFTGLGVWDQTIYPHQQLENDALHLGTAIQELASGEVKSGLRELEWWVAQSWYIPRLSFVPFTEEMDHHDPAKAFGVVRLGGPKMIAWGGQGHLPPYWSLWQEYKSIEAKAAAGNMDFTAETNVLADTRAEAISIYRDRLLKLAAALDAVSAELEAAAAAAS
jgi:hypothetical protein